jgi:hypothetical protein
MQRRDVLISRAKGKAKQED